MNKWEQFIQRLTKETEEGRQKWRDVSGDPDFRRENARDGIYLETVIDKTILVYPYKQVEFESSGQIDWIDEVGIEFVTRDGKREWQFPIVGHRFALLDAIEKKVSGADQFVDLYLAAQGESRQRE